MTKLLGDVGDMVHIAKFYILKLPDIICFRLLKIPNPIPNTRIW